MGVFKQGNNFFIEYRDAEGHRRQEKVGASRKLAETVLQKRLLERAERKLLNIKKPKKLLFKEFCPKYLQYSKANKREKMYLSESLSIKHILDSFRDYCLDEITPLMIEEYKQKRLKTVKPATVNRELACLNAMLNKAIEWNLIHKAVKIKLLKEAPPRVRYLSYDELKNLLSVCSIKLVTIILFAIATGLRRDELIFLQWKNIDTDNCIVHIEDSKTHSRRDISITQNILNRLTQLPKENNYVFGGHNHRKQFETAVKKAGIENFRFHDLRHTCASYLAINGASLLVIKELLGHKTLTMTMRYAHLCPDVIRFVFYMEIFWRPINLYHI